MTSARFGKVRGWTAAGAVAAGAARRRQDVAVPKPPAVFERMLWCSDPASGSALASAPWLQRRAARPRRRPGAGAAGRPRLLPRPADRQGPARTARRTVAAPCSSAYETHPRPAALRPARLLPDAGPARPRPAEAAAEAVRVRGAGAAVRRPRRRTVGDPARRAARHLPVRTLPASVPHLRRRAPGHDRRRQCRPRHARERRSSSWCRRRPTRCAGANSGTPRCHGSARVRLWLEFVDGQYAQAVTTRSRRPCRRRCPVCRSVSPASAHGGLRRQRPGALLCRRSRCSSRTRSAGPSSSRGASHRCTHTSTRPWRPVPGDARRRAARLVRARTPRGDGLRRPRRRGGLERRHRRSPAGELTPFGAAVDAAPGQLAHGAATPAPGRASSRASVWVRRVAGVGARLVDARFGRRRHDLGAPLASYESRRTAPARRAASAGCAAAGPRPAAAFVAEAAMPERCSGNGRAAWCCRRRWRSPTAPCRR
jgi:hypothetical protein